MSDPVTNSEVEDVLASIRRLVGGPRKTEPEHSPDQQGDRLILTPKQRVPESDVFQLKPEFALEADGEAIVTAETAEQGDETNEPGGEQADGSDEDAGDDEAVFVETNTLHGENEDAMDTERADDTPRQKAVASTGEDDADPGQSQSPKPPLYSNLSQKIAALETAIARTQDQWEPDGESGDAYAGTSAPAMSWQDGFELDGTGEPVAVAADATEPTAVVEDDETQIIDEDTLREMVADIVQKELREGLVAAAVREELQGDLGARITSNIRKLVRREIQLALTAKELE